MIFNAGEPVIILSDLILKQLLNIANIKVKNTNGRPLFDGHLCNCTFSQKQTPAESLVLQSIPIIMHLQPIVLLMSTQLTCNLKCKWDIGLNQFTDQEITQIKSKKF